MILPVYKIYHNECSEGPDESGRSSIICCIRYLFFHLMLLLAKPSDKLETEQLKHVEEKGLKLKYVITEVKGYNNYGQSLVFVEYENHAVGIIK